MAALTLRLLGELEALTGSACAPVSFPTRKSSALLAYLAASPGRRHSRERLASLLWDCSDARARANLRQTLARLRRAMPDSCDGCLGSDADAIWIEAESVDVDVHRFDELCDQGTPESLTRAVSLFRGELLEDLEVDEPAFEQWVALERSRLRARASDAMTACLARHLAARESAEGIAIAHRLLGIDPLQEHVHRALMKLYLQAGRRQCALLQYEACCELLDRELGVAPDEETEAVYRRIQDRTPSGLLAAQPPVRTSASGPLAEAPVVVVARADEPAGPSVVGASRVEAAPDGAVRVRVAVTLEMCVDVGKVGAELRDLTSTVLGLVLLAVPLALWVAWTETIFLCVLAAAAVAVPLIVVLAHLEPAKAVDGSSRPARGTVPRLSDEVLAELTELSQLGCTSLGPEPLRRRADRLLERIGQREPT